MPNCQKCGMPGARLYRGTQTGTQVMACSPACAKACAHASLFQQGLSDDIDAKKWDDMLAQRRAITRESTEKILRCEINASISHATEKTLEVLVVAKKTPLAKTDYRTLDAIVRGIWDNCHSIQRMVMQLPENTGTLSVQHEITHEDFSSHVEDLYDALLALERDVQSWEASEKDMATVLSRVRKLDERIALVHSSTPAYDTRRSPGSMLRSLPDDVMNMVAEAAADPDAFVEQRFNIRGK